MIVTKKPCWDRGNERRWNFWWRLRKSIDGQRPLGTLTQSLALTDEQAELPLRNTYFFFFLRERIRHFIHWVDEIEVVGFQPSSLRRRGESLRRGIIRREGTSSRHAGAGIESALGFMKAKAKQPFIATESPFGSAELSFCTSLASPESLLIDPTWWLMLSTRFFLGWIVASEPEALAFDFLAWLRGLRRYNLVPFMLRNQIAAEPETDGRKSFFLCWFVSAFHSHSFIQANQTTGLRLWSWFESNWSQRGRDLIDGTDGGNRLRSLGLTISNPAGSHSILSESKTWGRKQRTGKQEWERKSGMRASSTW